MLINNAFELEELTNLTIYGLKFILKRNVFVLHVTSVVTESVQATHRAVGSRTMDCFVTDLVKTSAMWLMDSRN